VYLVPLLLVLTTYRRSRRAIHHTSVAILKEARESGLTEPPSLHPAIDPSGCLGCGTCVPVCPESDVLGLIDGKAQVLMAANCIGHGACAEACPNDAITLVIGTERRGVDVPIVDAEFQTPVPGLFVVGELGGMGLIRNAIEQGRQVIDCVRQRSEHGGGLDLDVIVVGAGPAGLSASLAARQAGLRCFTLEQEELGGTVAHYPRRKLVLTAPVELPTFGRLNLRETTKEALLELWSECVAKAKLDIHFGERLEGVKQLADGFRVETTAGIYEAGSVVLALGRRGTPRKLGVKGEDQAKVVYRLVDPAQYGGLDVLVVGGGDSALEAAHTLADEPGTTVTLIYRGDAFGRAKPANRAKIAHSADAGRVRVLFRAAVREVRESTVLINVDGEPSELSNHAIIVCAGGILPTAFLNSIGIETRTLHGASPMQATH